MRASVSGGSGGGAKKKLGVQRPQAAAANRYTKSTNEGRRAGSNRAAGGPGGPPSNSKRLENDKAFSDGWRAGAAAYKKANPKPKSPFHEKISSSYPTKTGNSSKAPKVLQRRPTASRFARG